MSNILFIYETKAPTVRILEDMFLYLPKSFRLNCKFEKITELTTENVKNIDVAVFIRMHDLASLWLAKQLKDASCLVISFCDDIPFVVDKKIPVIPWRYYGMCGILSNSDVISSFNDRVLEYCRDHTGGKRVAKLDTIIRKEDFADKARHSENTVKIVYAANADHDRYFDVCVKPIMRKLVNRYGKKISFTFVCVRPDVREFESKTNIYYKEAMPLTDYRKYMGEEGFDIGLAPLSDENFSKYKNFNKYIEYSLSGVMGIYSKTAPYTDVVTDGYNGLLAEQGQWYEKLAEAIDNAGLRECCVNNAREQLLKNYSEENVILNLQKAIPELSQEKRKNNINVSLFTMKIIYKLFRPFDFVYLTLYYLFHGGFAKLTDMIQKHYRKKILMENKR